MMDLYFKIKLYETLIGYCILGLVILFGIVWIVVNIFGNAWDKRQEKKQKSFGKIRSEKLKFKRKGLFKLTWKVWLTSPRWKEQRKIIWIDLLVNILGIEICVANHSFICILFFVGMFILVSYVNWLNYIKFLEHSFDVVLSKGLNNLDKKGEVEK